MVTSTQIHKIMCLILLPCQQALPIAREEQKDTCMRMVLKAQMSFSVGHSLKEIVQALCVFREVQVSTHLKTELHLTMHVNPAQCNLEIELYGFGSYYIHGRAFLETLVSTSRHLKKLLAVTGPSPVLTLQCRRIGDSTSILEYTVSRVTDQSIEVTESVINKPDKFSGMTCKLTNFSVQDINMDLAQFTTHLHSLHVINPQVALYLRVMGLRRRSLSVQYDCEAPLTIAGSRFRLAASMSHYINTGTAQPKPAKLRILKGTTHLISPAQLTGVDCSVRLFCCVGISPHLRLAKGRKIPADRVCNSLHLTVFGPGSVPLVDPGSHTGFPLSSLAQWDSYGISLSAAILPSTASEQHIIEGNPVVAPSYAFEVRRSTPSQARSTTASRVSSTRTLHVFIFLEEVKATADRRTPSQHCVHTVRLLAALRENFDEFVTTHSKTFQKAIHSAMNKLICNYGSQSKTDLIVCTSIPLLAGAVSSIIAHSNNEQFRQKCLDMMKVTSVESTQSELHKQLWSLAKNKLSTKNIPTTPELEVASSQPSPRQQQQGGRKRRTSATEEGDQHSNEPEAVSVVEEESRPTRSLFLARVRSRGVESRPCSVLNSEEHSHAQDSSTNTTEYCNSDNDDDYFNALTNVLCSPFDQSRPLPDDDSHRFPVSQSAGINLEDVNDDFLSASPDCEHDSEDDILTSVGACKFDLTTRTSRQPPHADDSFDDDFEVLGSSPFLNTSFQSQVGSQIDESTAHFATPANTCIPNSPFDELVDISFASEDMNTTKEPSTQAEASTHSPNPLNEDSSPFHSLAGYSTPDDTIAKTVYVKSADACSGDQEEDADFMYLEELEIEL